MTTPVINPSTVVEPTFTATFTIKINSIYTATIGDRTGVVKQVDWTISGEESGQKFDLPQITNLGDPAVEGFVPLANLTEATVIAWIEATETRLSGIKAHIQFVIDKEVAKSALTLTSMPWAPIVETPTTTPTP